MSAAVLGVMQLAGVSTLPEKNIKFCPAAGHGQASLSLGLNCEQIWKQKSVSYSKSGGGNQGNVKCLFACLLACIRP